MWVPASPMRGGSGSDSSASRRVVVVGGGIAGSLVAKSLQFHADVVLVDPKEYFEVPWANMRSKVEPLVAEQSLVNHSDYLFKGKLLVSSAASVTEDAVVTVGAHREEYAYLVIATGHSNPTPRSRGDRLDQFHEENAKIINSQSILIIGGGPTGVELAAEIAVDYPHKKVTLVHNGPRLLEFIGYKAGNKALRWLKSKNVEVLLDESIDLESISEEDRFFKTLSGKVIMADCHFLCVGRPLGSSWLRESEVLNNCLDDAGRLMVDSNLRVRGHRNIFAVGDITDVSELKQGYMAQKHAMVVAKNIKLLMNGAKDSKLVKYRPTSATVMVSLGRKDAVAQLPCATIIGQLPGLMKSRDLFVQRTRRQLGIYD